MDETTPLASRGGLKLQAAFAHWPLDVRGRRCIDVGASTGGFTDVLLRAGAAHVTAIEGGHGQMRPHLASDPRVTLLERSNFKTLPLALAPGPFEAFVVDVSFVAARTMLRPLALRLSPGASGVVLVKPQFELPGELVPTGGVSDSRELRRFALRRFRQKAEALGYVVHDAIDCPVAGGDGNVEWLVWLELPVPLRLGAATTQAPPPPPAATARPSPASHTPRGARRPASSGRSPRR